jgi:hypothetical protein
MVDGTELLLTEFEGSLGCNWFFKILVRAPKAFAFRRRN